MIITPPTNGGIVPPWMLPKPDPNTPRVMQPSEHRDGYEQIIGSNIAAWLDEQRKAARYHLLRSELPRG